MAGIGCEQNTVSVVGWWVDIMVFEPVLLEQLNKKVLLRTIVI